MALQVHPLLRIVDADTGEIVNLGNRAVFDAVLLRTVRAFRLLAMSDGLAALEHAPGQLAILAVIGFGRVGKSMLLNAFLALLRECAVCVVGKRNFSPARALLAQSRAVFSPPASMPRVSPYLSPATAAPRSPSASMSPSFRSATAARLCCWTWRASITSTTRR